MQEENDETDKVWCPEVTLAEDQNKWFVSDISDIYTFESHT